MSLSKYLHMQRIKMNVANAQLFIIICHITLLLNGRESLFAKSI